VYAKLVLDMVQQLTAPYRAPVRVAAVTVSAPVPEPHRSDEKEKENEDGLPRWPKVDYRWSKQEVDEHTAAKVSWDSCKNKWHINIKREDVPGVS
jgi:hypothetical protein